MSRVGRIVLGLSLIGLISACAPQRSIRVEPVPGSQRGSAPAVSANDYVVVRGDTLYGIAFRHKLDNRELATRNGITAPYTIYPGQRLRLGEADARISRGRGRDSSRGKSARSGVVAPIVSSAPQPAAPAVSSSQTAVAESTTSSPPEARPAGSAAEPIVQSKQPVKGSPAVTLGPLRWRWPSEGKLISSFQAGDPTRQGINLAGGAGDPVLAAASGVVVYSGSGLIGYGELVIIKHDETWLSAYGHNRKRLVAEGDAVAGGQQVAEMGRSGASRDMLHFEVRKNGRPVDPLSVLPRQ